MPPIIAINGKRDNVVGWAEKLGFYAAMREHRHGGTFYWDSNDHYSRLVLGNWGPIVNPAALYRFRSDVSYPAFTNCELDSDPGDGTFASGDSIGHTFLEDAGHDLFRRRHRDETRDRLSRGQLHGLGDLACS